MVSSGPVGSAETGDSLGAGESLPSGEDDGEGVADGLCGVGTGAVGVGTGGDRQQSVGRVSGCPAAVVRGATGATAGGASGALPPAVVGNTRIDPGTGSAVVVATAGGRPPGA